MNVLDTLLEKARFKGYSDVHIDEKGQENMKMKIGMLN